MARASRPWHLGDITRNSYFGIVYPDKSPLPESSHQNTPIHPEGPNMTHGTGVPPMYLQGDMTRNSYFGIVYPDNDPARAY